MIPQFLLAAPASGSGKTTIARGLMALLTGKGYRVQPFKCGPDYIDTKFHRDVCGRPSVNLDTFMASPQHIGELYVRYASKADICVVEGMMGLFDGYDRDRGSSAEVAQVLSLPVVLVVDARSAAYSVAPLLSGFLHFNQQIRIAGVIFNKVGSTRHQEMLRQVCEDVGIECLGMVPRNDQLGTGSRYLGLDFSQMTQADEWVGIMNKSVNWRRLLQLTSMPRPAVTSSACRLIPGKTLIACDGEAFSFLYQETLDRFEHYDFFQPEDDVAIPEDIDLLYLPGGYPEKHLQELVGAQRTRDSIKTYAGRGGRVVAECGGMIYLCRSIVTDEGTFPMCGVLPATITARKEDRKLSLGYRRFFVNDLEYRGHEFHYTQFMGDKPASSIPVTDAGGRGVDTTIFRNGNIFASYTHLYWGTNDLLSLFSS